MLLPLLGVGGGLSGLGVLGAVQLCGVLSVDSVAGSWNMSPAASRTARAGRRSLGRAPTPPPTPRTPAPRWASAVTRRGGGSRKEENVLSCGIWCNEANLPHNHQEAGAGGWYFSAMPLLKPHCGGCSGHLLPLWLENLLMRPLSREECSVFT